MVAVQQAAAAVDSEIDVLNTDADRAVQRVTVVHVAVASIL